MDKRDRKAEQDGENPVRKIAMPKRVQHPAENDYGGGVNVGVGLGPEGNGEAEGDGLDEAIASLALASSSIFFSSA